MNGTVNWYASIKIELSGITAEDSYPPLMESKQGEEGLAGVLLKYLQREGRVEQHLTYFLLSDCACEAQGGLHHKKSDAALAVHIISLFRLTLSL